MTLPEEVARRLVRTEVFSRVNHLVSLAQQHTDDFWENCENMDVAKCPYCGSELPGAEECATPGDHDEYVCYICPQCKEGFDDPDTDIKEVFEWWMVSDWLAEHLQALGEVIYDGEDGKIWGRCTTGQAIEADYAFCELGRRAVETGR